MDIISYAIAKKALKKIETFEKVVKDIVKEEESRQMNIFDTF